MRYFKLCIHGSALRRYYANGSRCAFTGGTFYYPQTVNFPSEFVGKYFFNDLCQSKTYNIDPNNPGSQSLISSYSPIGLEVDRAGNLIYVENRGGVGIIQGSATNGPAIVTQPADATLAPGSAATFILLQHRRRLLAISGKRMVPIIFLHKSSCHIY